MLTSELFDVVLWCSCIESGSVFDGLFFVSVIEMWAGNDSDCSRKGTIFFMVFFVFTAFFSDCYVLRIN